MSLRLRSILVGCRERINDAGELVEFGPKRRLRAHGIGGAALINAVLAEMPPCVRAVMPALTTTAVPVVVVPVGRTAMMPTEAVG